MILTDLFESPEIHNQDRLDSVLGRCIELIHEKNGANPKKYGRVAACIIDMKNRKVFGINSPGADGRRRHAERMAIDAYHKRYGKILPGAIIVTTLSPCNRDMVERDGPSCQDLLMQAGIEKVYSGYMDPSQHSEHPFTEELTKNDDLWRRCKEFSDSFVHDDLTESQHNTMAADQVLDYVKRTHAPEEFDIEYSITDHPEWELKTIPLSQLNLDPDGETQDPYNRVNWVDDDKVQELIPRIGSVLKSNPIVVDPAGWIIDGNHRAIAAVEAGLDSVPAYVPVKQGVTEGESNDTAISLSKLGKFHPGADTLAEFVPERTTAQYALHPDKWESTFYSLTNKDSDKLKYYGPKKISIPPGTLVGDMAIANKFYRAKTPEEKQQYAELYKASLQPYPVDVSAYRMPELLIPRQGVAEDTQQLPGDFKLMGQNLFLKNLARNLKQRYPDATVKLLNDRVTAYHNKGDDEALSVMGTEVMDSGYIGVGLDDAFTESFQGVLVPTIKQTTEQLLAANPGTRPALFLSTDNWNPDAWTHIADKLGYRLVADDEPLDEGANWDDEEDSLVEALESWMMMDYDDQTIKTILSSPEAEPYKDPPGGVQWLYRAIVPRDREMNSIKASGPVIAFATEMAGAITFIQSLETSEDWVIIRKPFDPADFLLDFTAMYEDIVEPDQMSRYEVEDEVWMKAVPAYTKANKQEIVYTSKEHYGDDDWRKDDYKPKSTSKSNLRRPEDEPVIMRNPGEAYYYAKDVIKGRWPEAEPYIIQGANSNDKFSIGISIIVNYARDVIGGRWPEAEPVIMKNPEYAYQYARDVIGGRWPKAEPYIMKDPVWALFYAQNVIKGRWPEAEPIIMKSRRSAEYAKLFNLDTPAQDMAENFADGRNPGNQIREKLNAWMNQDQSMNADPTKRTGLQSHVWTYIQKNINSILSDKGADGKGSYPAAPYAAWLLVQHMDATPNNQSKFASQLEQAGLDPTNGKDGEGKLQFIKDRAAVNQLILKLNDPKKYLDKHGKPLTNPTADVRDPNKFDDAGIEYTSAAAALDGAIAAGNTLLVDAVKKAQATTQPSYKQSANENFADGKNPGRKGLAKRSGVNTKASVSSLRKTAKNSSGEKQRMAHWLANMKAGRAKARKK